MRLETRECRAEPLQSLSWKCHLPNSEPERVLAKNATGLMPNLFHCETTQPSIPGRRAYSVNPSHAVSL
jgi:hypothetical protein